MAFLPEGVKVEVRLFISKEGFIVGGEGLIEILEAVKEHGSLSLAAKSMGMTYKKVWGRITEAERILGVRLVERQRGRGASRLTRAGLELIRLYREAESRLKLCLTA